MPNRDSHVPFSPPPPPPADTGLMARVTRLEQQVLIQHRAIVNLFNLLRQTGESPPEMH